mgnify:CR=1 FL=1
MLFHDGCRCTATQQACRHDAHHHDRDRHQQHRAVHTAHTVVEIASNDGYLLKNFAARGIPVLGVEPAANVAEAARAAGIPTEVCFFTEASARSLRDAGHAADLIVANNVLAHVPDLNGFIAGLATLIKPTGTITCEFSHVLRMLEGTQFDSVYHEHFCYFSLHVAIRAFERHGLAVVDVEEIPTHGGSLRVYVAPAAALREISGNVGRVLALEDAAGSDALPSYARFADSVHAVKRDLLSMLIDARRAGRHVVAYGATAKGNTLLNYCGIGTDLVEYIADRNPHKQGRLAPGTRIPVVAPARIDETRPDDILILAWNLTAEVTAQLAHVRQWGARFLLPLPHPRVLD